MRAAASPPGGAAAFVYMLLIDMTYAVAQVGDSQRYFIFLLFFVFRSASEKRKTDKT
jgi:hypothetical protein